MTTTQPQGSSTWGTDFFGALNEMPPEVVAALIESLEFARTEPSLHEARRTLLRDLDLMPGRTVLEGGCGTGAALPDLLDVLGREGQILGVDPTIAFVETARRRAAELGARNARYEIGDIRALPVADGSVDAAFCDKVLVHAGPATVAVGELARVVRPGGRVGALEWALPVFLISSTQSELMSQLNEVSARLAYDAAASANLARYFHAAGLIDVRGQAFLAHAESLDGQPFWRSLLQGLVTGFVGAGLLSEGDGQALLTNWEELNRMREFSLTAIIQTAVGTKPA